MRIPGGNRVRIDVAGRAGSTIVICVAAAQGDIPGWHAHTGGLADNFEDQRAGRAAGRSRVVDSDVHPAGVDSQLFGYLCG